MKKIILTFFLFLNLNSTLQAKLIMLMGPSGVGKTTLINHLLSKYPKQFKRLTYYTTRPARNDEVEGEEYIFLSKVDFFKKAALGQWLMIFEFSGNFYAFPKSYMDMVKKDEKFDYLSFAVTTEMHIVADHYFKDFLTTVYIAPPSFEVLLERLTDRGTETPESIRKRGAFARYVLSDQHLYKNVITNDRLEDTQLVLEKMLVR